MLTKDTNIVAFMDTLDTAAFVFERFRHLPPFAGNRFFQPAINDMSPTMLRDAGPAPMLFLDDLKDGFADAHLVH